MARAAFGILSLLLVLAAAPALAQREPPYWRDLSPRMQGVLGPIEGEWAGMQAGQRRKWIAIAQQYDTLTPVEQQHLLSRMKAWAKLAPEAREQARDRYREWLAIPPERREALRERWQEYQNLPPEERARIRAGTDR